MKIRSMMSNFCYDMLDIFVDLDYLAYGSSWGICYRTRLIQLLVTCECDQEIRWWRVLILSLL